jgi:hypothetical protein
MEICYDERNNNFRFYVAGNVLDMTFTELVELNTSMNKAVLEWCKANNYGIPQEEKP